MSTYFSDKACPCTKFAKYSMCNYNGNVSQDSMAGALSYIYMYICTYMACCIAQRVHVLWVSKVTVLNYTHVQYSLVKLGGEEGGGGGGGGELSPLLV